jgi:hypothetical protein
LFDKTGRLRSKFAELAPKGDRRMSANPGYCLNLETPFPAFFDFPDGCYGC